MPASKPDDIDLIVCATSTPDYTFPSTATMIQAGLGITHGAAFDLQAVCTGFVYGVATADKFLASGSHKRALVIGAETFSRILDWNDRTTCVLFGDGAGAVVLEAQEGEGNVRRPRRADLASALRRPLPRQALCRRRPRLDQDHGRPEDGRPRGLPLRGRHGDRRRSGCVRGNRHDRRGPRLVRAAPGEQAHHHRERREARDRPEKVVITVDRHGNTSAASIPLALDVARQGRAHQGRAIS